MSDTTNRQCTVSGGSASTEAQFTDMRSAAGRLGATGGQAGYLRGQVLGIAACLPEKSAILSPGSAVDIAQQVAGLTLNLTALGLHMEFTASTLRWSATVYELTDTAQRALLAAVNVATAPARLSGDLAVDAVVAAAEHPWSASTLSWDKGPWAGAVASHLQQQLINDPALVDGLVPWTGAGVWVAGSAASALGDVYGQAPDALQHAASWFSPSATVGDFAATHHLLAPPPAQDFEGQIAWLLAVGRSLGYFDDTRPLAVTQAREQHRRTRKRQLSDVTAAAADVEHRSGADGSLLLVRRVVGADGTGAWVVAIPGTSHWPLRSDHGPSDTAANLATMAGASSSLYPAVDKALTAAMKESGVKPGTEPVLVTGHSQGGIVAARLAVDDGFRTKFDVREVVTDGSPIDRIPIPDDVHVLSIENSHDIVPELDGTAAPDSLHRVDVRCEAPPGEHLHTVIDAHDASRYARSAGELTIDSDDQLAQWYSRNSRFLDGSETDYEFDLRRP